MAGIEDILSRDRIAEEQSIYNQRAGEYENIQSEYDRALRLLDYNKQAYDRTANMWKQLEQQRSTTGSPYGSDRFYQGGEIYQFDPMSAVYRGAISNTELKEPGEYVAPELPAAPLPYDVYMADNLYYQIANDPNNPNYDAVQDSTSTGVVTPPSAPPPSITPAPSTNIIPVGGGLPPKPDKFIGDKKMWKWIGNEWRVVDNPNTKGGGGGDR